MQQRANRVSSFPRSFALLTLAASLPLWGAKTPQQVTDTVTVAADAVPLEGVPPATIALTDHMKWSDIYVNWKLNELKGLPSCVTSAIDPNQAYVFHIAIWSHDKPPQLKSSTWSVYSISRTDPNTLIRKLDATGNPLIFKKGNALILGFDVFDVKGGAATLSIKYKSSVTQGTPQNIQNLGQLVTSLLGLSAPTTKSASAFVSVALACQAGTDHLPFTLNVVETVGIPKPQVDSGGAAPAHPSATMNSGPAENQPSNNLASEPAGNHQVLNADQGSSSDVGGGEASDSNSGVQSSDGHGDKAGGDTGKAPPTQSPQAGQADCSALSSSNCTISRTFTFLDPEWWDVSLGQAIPGVKESQYSIVNSALQTKTTTHTDLYAFFDIDPAAYFFTKNTRIPHLAAGLPVAGKTLYRPFFGISENFSGWFGLDKSGAGFPVHLNVFGGIVYMKTTQLRGAPTTTAALASDSSMVRVAKPLFGIEVPLSSLISKVGKSGKSSNSNAKSGTTGANNGTSASQ